MSNRIDIDRLLVEMRSLKAQTQAFHGPGSLAARDVANPSQGGPDLRVNKAGAGFGELFNRAINQVNDTQMASAQTAKAYEQGQPGVDVTDVMIASEKAGVSFQAMVQVRNKLIEAYRDVMNMPI
jgi:flagellar hook-basal body complex protein FliE